MGRSGTSCEVRDGSADPRIGPGWVGRLSGRSRTGLETLEEVRDGSGILREVRNGSGDIR